MIFVKCKSIEELRQQCKNEYDQYVSTDGQDFYFRSNIPELDEYSGFNQIIRGMIKDNRKDADICVQVYTDFREFSMTKEEVLQELQETEDCLRQQQGEHLWWMKMKEGKEKYQGLMFWVVYIENGGQEQELLYTAVHR